MSWALLGVLAFALGLSFLTIAARRATLVRMAGTAAARQRMRRLGGTRAEGAHPVIDLSRCLGCATCVAACPEEGVLEILHGQAAVVRLARCKGIAACERECPVGAVQVVEAPVTQRRDVPRVSERLEAEGAPGVFLAGEVTSHALIKTAVDHGKSVALEVARRVGEDGGSAGALDLVIVGAGPAGLACALEARRLGLGFLLLDRAGGIGGTVATYPRRKLVVTRPLELPLYGRLRRTTLEKEELIALWEELAAREELPFRGGEELLGIDRLPGGRLRVRTTAGDHEASHVCLALGRRGTPRPLGVPGEDLPKVAYGLLDARLFGGRRVLVVGGGDSAVEAALGLSAQPGTQVTLSYRKAGFFRASAGNERRLEERLAAGGLRLLLESRVTEIRADEVVLAVGEGDAARSEVLPNDDVFVLAGGTSPTALLERCGVSVPAPVEPLAPPAPAEEGTGLQRALGVAFALTLATCAFAVWNSDYYLLPLEHRPTHPKHDLLRPGLGVGLGFGLAAAALVLVNLAYLVRRSPRTGLRLGSLQGWMTSHVATGLLAFLCVTLHSAMMPRDSVGGHAFWVLALLLVTGAVGRYLYAWVPRAANGRELELLEVKERLARMAREWDRGERAFRARVRDEVDGLVEETQWRSSLPGRVLSLVSGHRALRRRLLVLAREAEARGVAEETVRETLALARRAHRTALAAAHYEDLRAALESWRYLHRWGALLLVLLVLLHVGFALTYGTFVTGGLTGGGP